MSLPWFAERVSGRVIRVGSSKRPEPFTHSFLLTDDGEFIALNTNPLTVSAIRTAIEAAKSFGFENPHWLHKENIIMTHKHANHGDGKKADGTLDQHAVQANVGDYLEAMKAGKVQVLAVGDPVPIPGQAGVSAKTFIVKE